MLYLPKTAISYEIINLLNYIILFKFLQRKGIIKFGIGWKFNKIIREFILLNFKSLNFQKI